MVVYTGWLDVSRPVYKVLMVDDDEFVYSVVKELLSQVQRTNYVLEWRSTFEDGLEAMVTNSHDAYLLDYHIGEQNGLDLLAKAKAEGCRAPALMLTSRDDRELDQRAMELGASDYLIKGQFGVVLLDRSIRYAIEQHLTTEALRESEERYALAAEGAQDGIWDWNVESNEIYFSPRWKELLGFQQDELADEIEAFFTRIHPEDQRSVRREFRPDGSASSTHFELEFRILHRDGEFRWMLCRGAIVRNAQGQAIRMAGSMADITRRAAYDALTELPNRSLFLDRLERQIAICSRHPSRLFAVLFLDLDRFKIVNDSLGHLAGDVLLVAVADRLKTAVRQADTVARLGGDEFAILLHEIGEASDATRAADRICEALSEPVVVGGREITVGTSIGIALSSGRYDKAEDFLRNADTAMYQAKASRRARYEIFDEKMRARAVKTLQLETDLRRDVIEHKFELNYQPIISLSTSAILGFEALIRWRRGDELVPPSEFIPIAEETGIISTLDGWSREQACRQLLRWEARSSRLANVSVSVNLSSHQFRVGDICHEIDALLETCALAPNQLTLELTESIIIENPETARLAMHKLRDKGVRLALDDFGTAYSSLSYLHRLPFDVLKIDRSFVKEFESSGVEGAIVEAIITLAHRLGIEVTAEGVETRSQLARLRELGCDSAQGYLIAPPLDEESAFSFLQKHADRWQEQTV